MNICSLPPTETDSLIPTPPYTTKAPVVVPVDTVVALIDNPVPDSVKRIEELLFTLNFAVPVQLKPRLEEELIRVSDGSNIPFGV